MSVGEREGEGSSSPLVVASAPLSPTRAAQLFNGERTSLVAIRRAREESRTDPVSRSTSLVEVKAQRQEREAAKSTPTEKDISILDIKRGRAQNERTAVSSSVYETSAAAHFPGSQGPISPRNRNALEERGREPDWQTTTLAKHGPESVPSVQPISPTSVAQLKKAKELPEAGKWETTSVAHYADSSHPLSPTTLVKIAEAKPDSISSEVWQSMKKAHYPGSSTSAVRPRDPEAGAYEKTSLSPRYNPGIEVTLPQLRHVNDYTTTAAANVRKGLSPSKSSPRGLFRSEALATAPRGDGDVSTPPSAAAEAAAAEQSRQSQRSRESSPSPTPSPSRQRSRSASRASTSASAFSTTHGEHYGAADARSSSPSPSPRRLRALAERAAQPGAWEVSSHAHYPGWAPELEAAPRRPSPARVEADTRDWATAHADHFAPPGAGSRGRSFSESERRRSQSAPRSPAAPASPSLRNPAAVAESRHFETSTKAFFAAPPAPSSPSSPAPLSPAPSSLSSSAAPASPRRAGDSPLRFRTSNSFLLPAHKPEAYACASEPAAPRARDSTPERRSFQSSSDFFYSIK